MSRTFAWLLICFAVGGCSLWPRKGPTPAPVILSAASAPACTNAPTLPPLEMLPTRFTVVKDPTGIVWLALDPQSYENLSRNLNAMRLALSEQRRIIAYYGNCVGLTPHGN